jgi:hypothetical protein
MKSLEKHFTNDQYITEVSTILLGLLKTKTILNYWGSNYLKYPKSSSYLLQLIDKETHQIYHQDLISFLKVIKELKLSEQELEIIQNLENKGNSKLLWIIFTLLIILGLVAFFYLMCSQDNQKNFPSIQKVCKKFF